MRDLKLLFPSFSFVLIICIVNSWSGANAYRDDGRILKWSPAWLSSDPERYSGSSLKYLNRPTSTRGLYYKRLTDEEPQLHKWSPWYFPNPKSYWNNGKRANPVVWDDGDRFPSAGSPEWFQDDELINK